MNIQRILLAGVILTAGLATASAQAPLSSYFLETMPSRHQLNPAFSPASDAGYKGGYFGIPLLGGLNAGMHGNLHLSSLFYNRDGKTYAFTSPEVSASEVLANIHDRNRIGAELKLGVIDFGFRAFGGYNTVGINVVGNGDIAVPGSLFSLIKEGVSNTTYDLSSISARSTAYAEIALNHSRDLSKIVPGLSVGATVKVLLGLEYINADIRNTKLQLGEDEWIVTTDADLYASGVGMRFTTAYDDKYDRYYLDGITSDSFSLGGGGLAFDLGAQYKWRDFNFSLAINDLGFICWNKTQYASTNGRRTFNSDAYTIAIGEEDSWDALESGLTDLFQLDNHGDIGTKTYAVNATLNLGVEYELPYYRKLRFGVLNSTYFNGPLTANTTLITANVRPVKAISATLGLNAGTYGAGLTWLVDFTCRGINFYVGMDRIPGMFSKNYLPLNSNADLKLGVNIPL